MTVLHMCTYVPEAIINAKYIQLQGNTTNTGVCQLTLTWHMMTDFIYMLIVVCNDIYLAPPAPLINVYVLWSTTIIMLVGQHQICQHNKNHNNLKHYASIMLAYLVDILQTMVLNSMKKSDTS